jgi:hypothetical protein
LQKNEIVSESRIAQIIQRARQRAMDKDPQLTFGPTEIPQPHHRARYHPSIKRISVPTPFFADPFGYQGVSIDLIEAALSHWGSDFLFFFNYNRINMNLGSDAMNEPINEFFSAERAAQLRETISRLRPAQREEAIALAMPGNWKRLDSASGFLKLRYR